MRIAPRKLTPQQEDAIRALGGHVRTCPPGTPCIHDGLAKRYGVSKRTILRTIARAPLSVHVVEIGGYYAQFEITDQGPIQRTDWRAAA